MKRVPAWEARRPLIGSLALAGTRVAWTSRGGFMSMKDGGTYSRARVGARHVIDGATGLVLDALDRMAPGDDGTVFTMADTGCGAPTAAPRSAWWARCSGELRRRLPSRPLQMVHTDLPRHGFSELFRTVLGSGHLDGIGDLSVFASGTSFHRTIFPPATLNLGFSAMASHDTDAVPCATSDHVHMVGATGSERAARCGTEGGLARRDMTL